MDNIDYFVFHQANRYMLEHLKRKLKVPDGEMPIDLGHCGNTVSSSIPILLKDMEIKGVLKAGQCLLMFDFGVGYLWSGAIVGAGAVVVEDVPP